ncbi:unnamed protein product [Orchesella dallaii]|uniref:Uncharacterized protein n=1 Tax=Orchesella dallaii TaxID=48710 RepID=A0ABP1QXB5_9HEXA
MAEMHLDLCIQSTGHLLETVSGIKENIRILEVFLNSGISNIDYNKPIGFSSDYSSTDGRGFVGTDRLYHLSDSTASNGKQHLSCCCMCRFRLPDTETNQNGTYSNGRGTISASKASVGTVSLSSETHSQKKFFFDK